MYISCCINIYKRHAKIINLYIILYLYLFIIFIYLLFETSQKKYFYGFLNLYPALSQKSTVFALNDDITIIICALIFINIIIYNIIIYIIIY